MNDAFAPGQVYVALSRLRSLEGLILRNKISYESLGIEPSVKEFSTQKASVEVLEEKYVAASQKYITDFVLKAFNFHSLDNQIGYHLVSYNKEENRSKKQKHKDWAKKIDSEFRESFDVANKFIRQLQRIIQTSPADGMLQQLKERVTAAHVYFEPILKSRSSYILDHIEAIRREKGIKKYLTELQMLELQFFSQNQKMQKALALIDAGMNKTYLDKKILSKELEERQESKKKTTKKATKTKEKKIPTKTATYNLFQEGKNIDEIASERQLTKETIAKHLRHFVETGVLSAREFVLDEQIEEIGETIMEYETVLLTELKRILGDDYSFENIGFVVAEYKFHTNS